MTAIEDGEREEKCLTAALRILRYFYLKKNTKYNAVLSLKPRHIIYVALFLIRPL